MSGTNNQILFCKKCVISNQRPSSVVEFKNKTEDIKPMIELKEGICSACLWEDEKKKIDWDKRKNELAKLCDEYRKTDGTYDCIVPGSGGKDSAFQAHVLKYKYGTNTTQALHIKTRTNKILETNVSIFFDTEEPTLAAVPSMFEIFLITILKITIKSSKRKDK